MITYPVAWALAAMLLVFGIAVIIRALPARSAAVVPAPAPMLQRVDALNTVERHCVVEGRPTLHVRFGCGSLMCLDCRTEVASTQHQGDQ